LVDILQDASADQIEHILPSWDIVVFILRKAPGGFY